jgi:phospholipid/cholesterol/gamma-HCH transport system permease protein
LQTGWLSKIGVWALGRLRAPSHLAALIWAVLRAAVEKQTWSRTVTNVFARQVLFTGIEASRFILLLAFMVGILIVVQTQVWLAKVGQSGLLGPVLVMVVVREVGPLLVNFVVIGRSGTAMSTELGIMKISGEVRLLDALGLDPFIYLVVPRVLGAAVSIFCLTVIFIVGSFVSGYFSGLLLGANVGDPGLFAMSVFRAVQPSDVFNLLAKTFIPGLVTGAICCTEGLSVSTAITEVPQATSRALVKSVGALFVISALVSLLTYM